MHPEQIIAMIAGEPKELSYDKVKEQRDWAFKLCRDYMQDRYGEIIEGEVINSDGPIA